MRGDLQEGHVYGNRLCGYASRCQIPLFPSTKSGFLCFFGLRAPHFRAFRAQNRGFCAFLSFGTPVFGHFEHKIGVFVLFWPSGPPFLGFSSTKSAFLCSGKSIPGGCSGWSTLGFCPGSAAPARGVLLGVWRGLFVGCKEGKELFSEGGGVCEEQCVHAGGYGTLYVGWLVVCEEAL